MFLGSCHEMWSGGLYFSANKFLVRTSRQVSWMDTRTSLLLDFEVSVSEAGVVVGLVAEM